MREKGWRNLCWKHGNGFRTEVVGGKKLKTETEWKSQKDFKEDWGKRKTWALTDKKLKDCRTAGATGGGEEEVDKDTQNSASEKLSKVESVWGGRWGGKTVNDRLLLSKLTKTVSELKIPPNYAKIISQILQILNHKIIVTKLNTDSVYIVLRPPQICFMKATKFNVISKHSTAFNFFPIQFKCHLMIFLLWNCLWVMNKI